MICFLEKKDLGHIVWSGQRRLHDVQSTAVWLSFCVCVYRHGLTQIDLIPDPDCFD